VQRAIDSDEEVHELDVAVHGAAGGGAEDIGAFEAKRRGSRVSWEAVHSPD